MAQLEMFEELPEGREPANAADNDDQTPIDPEIGIFCNPAASLTVRAAPMTLGTYLDLRGWPHDKDTDPGKEGYLIERPDMGPPNHPKFPFFIAWLSKYQFDRFYVPAKTAENSHSCDFHVVGDDGVSGD